MTQDSRARFEKLFGTLIYADKAKEREDKRVLEAFYKHAWQASEQRILDMLGSDYLKSEIQRIIQTSTVRGSRAGMIIKAITTRIKGE